MDKEKQAFEEWRDIPGFNGKYKISTDGKVMSFSGRGCNPKLSTVGRLIHISPNKNGYPTVSLSRDGQRKPYRVHRLMASAYLDGFCNDLEVDHINGIKTDNRVENLRMCTHSQNNRNRRSSKLSQSKYIGVYHGSTGEANPWEASIRTDYGRVYLGRFPTEEAAAAAYNQAALKYHGDFARLNTINKV